MALAERGPWLDCEPAPMGSALAGSTRARVAIVGGGLAGLATAWFLVRERPGLDVVLLEGGAIGSGSTGRSTGMIGPGVAGPIDGLVRRFGEAGARRVFKASEQAVELALALIGDQGLACDLEVTGQLVLAASSAQATALRAQATAFARLGLDVPFLEGDALRARFGSPAYRATLVYRRAALVDPVKLCRELARRLVARGVRIHEHTAVRAVEPGRVALANDGEVLAERVVVCTNAFTPRLGYLRGRVIPLHTHVLCTGPLGPHTLAELGWSGREGLIESQNFFSYFRLTADDRLLFGGGRPLYRAGDAVEAASPATWDQLERELARALPPLAGIGIERRWSGPVAFTLDRLPIVGELEEAKGVLFAGAWCGHGLALAVAGGASIAERVLGRAASRELPWLRGRAPWLPPDPLRGAGLNLYLSALARRDRRTLDRSMGVQA